MTDPNTTEVTETSKEENLIQDETSDADTDEDYEDDYDEYDEDEEDDEDE